MRKLLGFTGLPMWASLGMVFSGLGLAGVHFLKRGG